MCRRAWILATASALALTVPVRAEVRAVTYRDGAYRTVRVTQSGRGGVWAAVRRLEPGVPLNPNGDRNRDLWPSVKENSVAPHYPWAVWSRFDGTDYDLAWSRWSDGRWEPIRRIEEGHIAPGIDLDPDLQFDLAGRPFIVWWKDQGGRGRVYLSLFLDHEWMRPMLVSDLAMDARYPVLEVQKGRRLIVHYSTDEGLIEQVVLFDEPGTITDDVNPMDCLYFAGAARLVERY
jgi:hypothetical protein